MEASEAEIATQCLMPVSGGPLRGAGEIFKDFFAASALALAAFALYIIPNLCGQPVTETPEARIAVVAREMILSRDYVVPTMGGETRLNKPPLPYWLTVGAAKLLDHGNGPTQEVMERAVKLPPALLAALTLFVVVFFGSLVFGRPSGLLAGLLLGFSLMLPDFTWKAYGDIALMCACACMFCAASWLYASARPGIFCALALGLSLGLAVLSKGHIPVLLLAAPLLALAVWRRVFNTRKFLVFVAALIIAAAMVAPWFLAVKSRGGWDVMAAEVGDAVQPVGHRQDDWPIYYFYRLLGGLLPWTPLLLAAWLLFYRRLRTGDRANSELVFARAHWRFFTLAFVLGFIGFYVVPKQQEYYLLPLLPALALASGYVLGRFKTAGGVAEEWLGWSQILVGLILAAAVITFPAWPDEKIAKTAASLEALKQLRQSIPWGVSVPLGLALFALHCFIARQCVEGRPHVAGMALGLLACAGLAATSVYRGAHPDGQDSLAREAARLQTEINEATPARVYTLGMSQPVLVFYLQHPVLSLKELESEPVGQTGENAPQRILIVGRKDFDAFSKLENAAFKMPAADQNYAAVWLDKNTDWPRHTQRLRGQKKTAAR
jgi:4-amino-4-deoxy-L-arabinose transferase-like glycosyltransferase